MTVATTAGTANHDLVKSLGATYAFDYKSPTVIADILKVLKQGDVVFDCIGSPDAQKACAELASKLGGGKVPCLLWPLPTEYDNVEVCLGKFQAAHIYSLFLQNNIVNGLDPGLVNLDIGDAVWRKYIPEALAAGKFQTKPDPEVLKGGLGRVQEGIDILKKGVSAKKIVIEVVKKY